MNDFLEKYIFGGYISWLEFIREFITCVTIKA